MYHYGRWYLGALHIFIYENCKIIYNKTVKKYPHSLWNGLDVYKSIGSNLFEHHLFVKVLSSTMKLAILLTSLFLQLTLTSSMQGSMNLQRACEYF